MFISFVVNEMALYILKKKIHKGSIYMKAYTDSTGFLLPQE